MGTARGGVIIGLDVGATRLAGGVVDPAGRILSARTAPTDRLGRGEGILQNLLDVAGDLVEAARSLRNPILGLGVGVPGVIEAGSGTIGEDIQNLPELRGLALGRILGERTDLPVVVDNDVNALTLGEWTFGQARGFRHVAMLAVGTSVGGGLILDGRLVRGAGGYAGEIGHIPVDLDGPECLCGSKGCLKVFASGADIARQARELLRAGRPSRLRDLCGGEPARIEASAVFTAAGQGDPVAVTVVARAAQALGAGVATLIHLCNPEIIVLGGGVMEAGQMLLEPVIRWARYYAFEAAFDRTRIVRSSLTKESGVLGGAALFLYEQGRGRFG